MPPTPAVAVNPSAFDALSTDGVTASFPGWSLIEVTGRHRERFLGSQVTSDVSGLAEGESQLSALLDRSGRLQAFFFLRKRSDAIDLLVPNEIAAHCLERFESHIIADDVELALRDVGEMRLALGPAAIAKPPAEDCFPVTGWGSVGFVTWGEGEMDLPEIDDREIETLRVLGGPPAWAREVRLNQLINETALLDNAVSFDKGCFLGQETVAKVSSHRGAVRGPVLLELKEPVDDADALVGMQFGAGERARAGEVLSCAQWERSTWLQVSLHRELRIVGRTLDCVFGDDQVVEGVIHRIPLLRAPSPEEMADRLTVAASVAFGDDETDRSLELLERAVAICPSHADGFESLGVILGRLGRHEEAIKRMQCLLEIDPSSIMGHSNLSLFFNQLGDKEQAEHHLAMATRISMGGSAVVELPDRAEADTAEAEADEADRRRREGMFLQVLEIDPDDALAHFGMGELLVERGSFEDAVDHLQRAIASEPTHSAAILALGHALEGLGEDQKALVTYEQGVEIAAKKGDLATAQKMQERITALAMQTP
jgi:folate-binding protein YgfZ